MQVQHTPIDDLCFKTKLKTHSFVHRILKFERTCQGSTRENENSVQNQKKIV